MNDLTAGVDPILQALAKQRAPIGIHPDEDTWVALQTGTLSHAARLAVADHVGTCPDCALIFRAVSALHEAARSSGLAPATTRPRSFFERRAIVLAAAAVLIAFGFVAWLATRPAPAPSVASNDAQPPPRPRADSALKDPPAVREWALALAAPPVELPARYALITRGSDSDREFLAAFGAAIAPYRSGDYLEAAVALAEVAQEFPNVPEAAFYLGAARLLAGDAAGARDPFARAEQAESLADEARWFGAVAAERAGARTEADAMLVAICQRDGDYRDRACAIAGAPAVRR